MQLSMYLIISILLLTTLTGCSNTSNSQDDIKEKLVAEINYLDTQLSDILNAVNGISFKNYKVTAEKVNPKQEETASSKESGSSNSDSQSGESSGGESSQNSTKNYMNYNLEANSLLTSQRNTDWKLLKANIETLSTSWSTIVLDLYKLNIASEDILGFTKELNLAMQAIKKEDKNASLVSLAKLYQYLPKYTSVFIENPTKANILKTKSSVYNAYAIVELNKPDEVKKELTNAEQVFMAIVNDMGANKNSQFNINKAYILLKDLESAVDTKDIDIFYVKYRNLMEELNVIEK